MILQDISLKLQAGKAKDVKILVQQAIDEGIPAQTILEEGLLSGMNVIGEKFKNNEVFVPEVLVAARAMNMGANLLKLRPALEMKNGKLEVYKKYRGNINAEYRQYIKERLAGKSVRPGHVFIVHSGEVSDETIAELEEFVRELIPVTEFHRGTAGCTISSHCGPKTLGVLFLNE